MSDLTYLLEGDPDEQITWQGHATMYGGTVRGSRRSIAHLEATDQAARERFGVGIVVIQSAYNTGVSASAGTHDFDAVYDVHIPGVDWWTQQRFLRELGWAAWYRYPPTFGHHIHMISLGYRTRVGIYVPGQVDDYRRHAMGLAGQHDSGSDDTWHPSDIDSTIFDYPAWKAAQEDDMPYTEQQLTEIVREAVREEIGDELRVLRRAVRQQAESIRGRLRGESADLDGVKADTERLLELVGED